MSELVHITLTREQATRAIVSTQSHARVMRKLSDLGDAGAGVPRNLREHFADVAADAEAAAEAIQAALEPAAATTDGQVAA